MDNADRFMIGSLGIRGSLFAGNRQELAIAERFTDPSVKKTVEVDLALVDQYDALIGDLELYLTRTAKVDDTQTYHRLLTIPGVGKILALVLLYEIHDIAPGNSAEEPPCRLSHC